MKIGIISYPLNNNYGCHLQTYALYTVVCNLGHNVTYINRRSDKPTIWWWIKKIVKNLLNGRSPFFSYEDFIMKRKGKKLVVFFEKYIKNHTSPIYSSRELEHYRDEFNAIIVGSDQVWRPELLSDVRDYFLKFLGDSKTKRISYAASFGNDNPQYTSQLMVECGALISKFDAVSVREQSGMDIISKFGWIANSPQLVLDPTLLLSVNDYRELFIKSKRDSTVFSYILDDTSEKRAIRSEIASLMNLRINSPLDGCNQYNFEYPSVEDWLSGIDKSDFVITDSFHGTVFAVIFEKPFLVIVNQNRGASRFKSLLECLGLEERILLGAQDVERVLQHKIDWNNVKGRLRNERERSISFLKKELS